LLKRWYYGWVIAGTASSVLAVTYGVQFSFGVLIPDIEAETGWSRTQLSFAYSLYVLVYSVLSFAAGSLTDRWGPRPVIAIGATFLAVGYGAVGLATQLWHLRLALGVIAAIGMSASFVPCNATVVRWFVRHRGRALAIATAGTSLGGLLIPPVAGALSSAVGWRTTYLIMGGVTGVWLLAASRLMARSPEGYGLVVDGGSTERSGHPRSSLLAAQPDLDARNALRTARFWLIGVIFALTWLAVFFPLVHLGPFAASLGLTRTMAAGAVSAIGLGGLVGRLFSGPFSDRVGRLPTLAIVLGVQVGAFAVFALGDRAAAVYAGAVAFGLGYGGSTTLFPAVVGDAFGRSHVGAIVGLIFAGAGSLSAIGPTVAGHLYDTTGSYRLAFVLSSGANLAALAFLLVLSMTGRRTHRT
jgi:MFS family permease